MTPESYAEAREARIGADRMAMGLSCIPDPLRGDIVEVERLQKDNQIAWNKHADKAELVIYLQDDNDRLRAELRAERAEIERQRATLARIADYDGTHSESVRELARAALEPKP